jgi:hypothetical protein
MVGARNDFWFTDTAIDLGGITEDLMTGALEFEIEYGRSGGRKYGASNNQTIFVPLDPSKPFSTSAKLRPNEQQGIS